ncbi:MAG TPA: hypothetical protein VKQ36_07175 [Ktedonobacterales bacterium]|nr:hypothetical protein [Ktedonobacterales bacterium]
MAATSFDAQEAVTEARSANLPDGWLKYPTHRGLVLTRVITAGVTAILSLAFAIFIFFYAAPAPVFQIITVILFLAVTLWLGLISFRGALKLRDIDRYFFLITPQGFAQANGNKVIGLPLTDLTNVRLVRDLYGVSLLLKRRSGELVRVPGLQDYGQPTEIGRQMVAACNTLYAPLDNSAPSADRHKD